MIFILDEIKKELKKKQQKLLIILSVLVMLLCLSGCSASKPDLVINPVYNDGMICMPPDDFQAITEAYLEAYGLPEGVE